MVGLKTSIGLLSWLGRVQFRSQLGQTKEKSESHQEEVKARLASMRRTVEELKEKTWKLDTSTRNNLVFYGIKVGGRIVTTNRKHVASCFWLMLDGF